MLVFCAGWAASQRCAGCLCWLQVAAEGHSVLVFCAGRAASQSCAEVLSKELQKRLGPPGADAAAARAELIESLRIALSGSTDAAFEKLLGRWLQKRSGHPMG